ncbi:DGQHR domain-containing protein [Fusibacter bizertensis]
MKKQKFFTISYYFDGYYNYKLMHKTAFTLSIARGPKKRKLVFQSTIIICEETCGKGKDKNHIRKKQDSFKAIKENQSDFISILKNEFPDKLEILNKYNVPRYKIFYLYFSNNDLNLEANDLMEFRLLKFVEPQSLNYFEKMVKCIKLSSRYEIFRYLELKNEDIGKIKSDSSNNVIKAPIICPEDITGHKDGIRIVSFMMAAEKLIETCYVLRKDNWEDSMWLYQRLIDQKKIKEIRSFLGKKKQAFYNNIIVALPDNICFIDNGKNYKRIHEISNFEAGTILEIPNEMNSICVIDGQHRIFAHHEGNQNESDERVISELRQDLHLLVTGLIFPVL